MLDVRNIVLTEDEMTQCVKFSQTCAPNQQAIEFGQQSTKARGTGEIARDNLIGKIAEVAFSKMMRENYQITVPLDFNYYPLGQWDNQDAVINGWRIDIKGTRRGGRWMLIEWNKLNFRQHDHNLSHIYAMFSVDWDRQTDRPSGRVCYEGAASLRKLYPKDSTTKVFHKGDTLPNTRTVLQADNYGILFRDLYQDLDGLVAYLSNQTPPLALTEHFPDPSTRQTTED